jgi:OmpA-OmpF porin, OOP family
LVYGFVVTKEHKEKLLAKLERQKIAFVELVTDIMAPRSAISPFTFRAVKSDNIGHINTCAADKKSTIERLSMLVKANGFEIPFYCQTGLGMPDENWVGVNETYINVLGDFSSGSFTISNTGIRSVVPEGTVQQGFDTLVAGLRRKTPPAYQLRAILPESPSFFEAGQG